MSTATTKIVGTGGTAARSGSSVTWSSPANLTANDNVDATTGDITNGAYTEYLVGTMAGNLFSIPSDHTIDGVEISFEHRVNNLGTGTQVVASIQLVSSLGNGTDLGDNADITTTTRTLRTYGSPTNKHGLSLTPAVVNAGSFGFRMSIAEGSGSGNGKPAQVDYFQVTIYHSLAVIADKGTVTVTGQSAALNYIMRAAKGVVNLITGATTQHASKGTITITGRRAKLLTFEDWLDDDTAERVVLINLTSADTGVHRIAQRTFITRSTDSPANTLYQARLIGSVRISMKAAGLFGDSGESSVATIDVLNPDGALDDWIYETWTSVKIMWGDATWPLSRFSQRFAGKIASVEADDEAIHFATQDLNAKLQRPIQYVPMVEGPEWGELCPLSYGYPKNVKPMIQQLTNNAEFWVHEGGTCQDVAVTRYLNQAASTSPAITKFDYLFELGGDPMALVTVDVKGALDAAGTTWLQKPGEILKEALTRDLDYQAGMVLGGSLSPDTLVLGPPASDTDDFYNGVGFRCDHAGDPDKTDRGKGNATGYVGSTHTLSLTFSAGDIPTVAPAAGDLWRTENGQGPTMHPGPIEAADVHSQSFGDVDTALPYNLGVYENEKRSCEDFMRYVLGPAAWWWWNPASHIEVGVLVEPSGESADYAMDESDIDVERSPRRQKRPPPAWRVRLGTDRNHTVASGSVAGAVDMARAAWVQKKYRWVNRQDSDILAKYPKARDLEIESPICSAADGKTELDRVWALYSVQRYSHFYPTLARQIAWRLGKVVEVTDDRYGFDAGKNGVLIGLECELLDATSQVELWA